MTIATSPSERIAAKQDAWLKSMEGKKANADKLSNYTREKRIQEIIGIISCVAIWLYMLVGFLRDVHTVYEHSMLVGLGLCVILGLCFADTISGVVHWGLDTWGTPDTPVFGPFIRSFREHHVNPRAMCAHDFVQTNGDTFFVIAPFLAVAAVVITSIYVRAWGLAAVPFIAMTNEWHKMAHEVPAKIPPFVRWMQDHHLVLSRAHHNTHHVPPHTTSYCITTGWMNAPLNALGFWRAAEAIVIALTGAVPREDDFKWSCIDAEAYADVDPQAAKAARKRRAASEK